MRRRDFVKAVLAASVSPAALVGQNAPTSVTPSVRPPTPPGASPLPAPGPLPWMRGLMEVKALPMTPLVPDDVARTMPYFFSHPQLATLRQLCELFLPPMQGFPGAIDAGTPEFLDFLISVSPEDRQHMYRSGLDRLDSEARKTFHLPFVALTPAQANVLIRPWLRTWMPDHPPTEPYERFINLAHSDIRTATINSRPWSEAAARQTDRRSEEGLYWFPIDPDLHRGTQRDS